MSSNEQVIQQQKPNPQPSHHQLLHQMTWVLTVNKKNLKLLGFINMFLFNKE